ncbi:hypothetical protein Ancab_039142 [Ancistrocladus abbreviatus]
MSAQQQKTTTRTTTVKFLCSYGGKILPRHSDGKLRYVGGYTRVLSVHRSVSFSELMVKFGELCGYSATLKCKLPSEDMDVLVTIKSDEDLANMIEEYDRASSILVRDLKIRAILCRPKSLKCESLPSSSSSSSAASSFESSPTKSSRSRSIGSGSTVPKSPSFLRVSSSMVGLTACAKYDAIKNCNYRCKLQAHSRPSADLFPRSNCSHY